MIGRPSCLTSAGPDRDMTDGGARSGTWSSVVCRCFRSPRAARTDRSGGRSTGSMESDTRRRLVPPSRIGRLLHPPDVAGNTSGRRLVSAGAPDVPASRRSAEPRSAVRTGSCAAHHERPAPPVERARRAVGRMGAVSQEPVPHGGAGQRLLCRGSEATADDGVPHVRAQTRHRGIHPGPTSTERRSSRSAGNAERRC